MKRRQGQPTITSFFKKRKHIIWMMQQMLIKTFQTIVSVMNKATLVSKSTRDAKTNFRSRRRRKRWKRGHQNPGKLVSVGFRDWKKAKESFKKHMEKEYHKLCVLQATSFLKISAGKQLDIASQLDSQRTKEIAENRAAIEPIIRTILFCAEQELPLRGDHDSGALSLTRPEKKDGKFRALLRFRIESGDKNLEKCT
ncbi:TTF-type domain-containing protein [Trichonephila clavata]|uniref:TTF-type domain-containing protein n=1 Tax=Trichonephila clavata TaxID=2740835 RepID=A0A8X6IKZ8_TRICU|nr:TTF-type domain-containing protein [Trichonephila clavata]